MDDMVKTCRQYFAEQGLSIECFGVAMDMTFEL
jgi:hypothetical protein